MWTSLIRSRSNYPFELEADARARLLHRYPLSIITYFIPLSLFLFFLFVCLRHYFIEKAAGASLDVAEPEHKLDHPISLLFIITMK